MTYLNYIRMALIWVWTLAKEHPGITTPLVGALVTLALKPRSAARYAAIAAKNPVWLWSRVAAILQLLGALFPDPAKSTAILLKVITGKQDTKALLTDAAISLLTPTEKTKILSNPPPPPAKTDIDEMTPEARERLLRPIPLDLTPEQLEDLKKKASPPKP